MNQSSLSQEDWASKSEKYRKEKAHIRKILVCFGEPMNLAQIANQFVENFNYIPSDLCRRLREMSKEPDIVKRIGNITTWELKK